MDNPGSCLVLIKMINFPPSVQNEDHKHNFRLLFFCMQKNMSDSARPTAGAPSLIGAMRNLPVIRRDRLNCTQVSPKGYWKSSEFPVRDVVSPMSLSNEP